MIGSVDNLSRMYLILNVEGKSLLLSDIILELTLICRDLYIDDNKISDHARARAVNEAINRAISQQKHLLDETERYPDEVFSRILHENLVAVNFPLSRAAKIASAHAPR